MAKINKDEYLAKLNAFVGDRSDEEAINFLEDMTDAYNQLETVAKSDGVDWEAKYKENDEAWQKKYRNRFLQGTGSTFVEPEERGEKEVEISPETITVEDIWG